MGHFQYFVDLVKQSRLLAPNLKEMTLHYYTGDKFQGNFIAREIVRDHLLALRWMNPNAVIYLREHNGQGLAKIDYSLWSAPDTALTMEVTPALTAGETVAKVMMAARDPDEATPTVGSGAGTGGGAPVHPPVMR